MTRLRRGAPCALAIVLGCGAPRPSTLASHAIAHTAAAGPSTPFVGSQACAPCHQGIYDRWKKTPMANVVRDPRTDPSAILPDLATNTIHPFAKDDVALVYGSIWKQRYFTKVGDDYYVEPAQWDVTNRVWRRYFVENGTDWWATLYPPDNMKRPTGPLCDGCHSVGYDVKTKQVVEWNVGCERCHGGGAEHVLHPSRSNTVNPARMSAASANDTCIQCHSQGRPLANPIEGRFYDWPVGYQVGLKLTDFWKLEEHKPGETTFTHFAEGTAHKNRMQGNDFTKSVMYANGITCFNCHDVHGTDHPAQLRQSGNAMCLQCHSPGGTLGPRARSVAEHTLHAEGSAGSECVACHMPNIETTIADVRVHAHTFEFITPAMTDQFRVPNPCTTCHADKTAAWAAGVLAAAGSHSGKR